MTEANRQVFVVHGRDMATQASLFALLRAFGLRPIEWSEAVRSTGTTMPSVLQVLRSGLEMPKAVVVLLTPDDQGTLRPKFYLDSDPEFERELVGQPRLNVVFEAGLACALFPDSTIFVERGPLRPFTDIEGILRIRISTGQSWKSELRRRLSAAGCELDDNDEWQEIGFHPSLQDRWAVYDSHGRTFTNLLDREELHEARTSPGLLAKEVRAFCLLSSIQEGKDMAYWVEANRSSHESAMLLAEFLLNSPHERPKFRAARALELFDREANERALAAAEEAGDRAASPSRSDLINAARSHSVEEYTRTTPFIRNEEIRARLLADYMQFPRYGEVRLINFQRLRSF